MKKLFLFVFATTITLQFKANNPINAIIGDISYDVFKANHSELVSENQRIQIHLNYVKNILQNKPTQHLNYQQRSNRTKMLVLLQKYIDAAQFPKNKKYSKRRPCFIDDENNICAVGYLVANTAGIKVAQYINQKYQYEYISNMHDDVLDKWINENGLTKEECATIQPSYWPTPSYNTEAMDKKTATSTALYTGVNLTSGLLNLFPAKNSSKALPIIGIVSSVGQIHFGFKKFPKPYNSWGTTYQNKPERNVSMWNIALGTSNLLLSTWRLRNIIVSEKEKRKTPKSQIGFYLPQSIDNRLAGGISFVRNI